MKKQWQGFQSPLAEGIKNFLRYKRSLGQSFITEEYVFRALDTFLIKQNAKVIKDLNMQLIEDFISSRPRNRPRSYNHMISAIDRLFSWLFRQSYLTKFPLHLQKRRETSQQMPFLFTPNLAQKLLESTKSLKDTQAAPLRGPTYKTIFALMYGLGLRVGEVCRLCIQDVNFERSLLIINQTKFCKSRLIPFGPRMKELLESYIRQREDEFGVEEPHKPMFSFGSSIPINRHSIDRIFRKLFFELGIQVPDGVSSPNPHSLRHSFAVGTLLHWYRSGINPQIKLFQLSTFLGHVSPVSTAVYLTITPDLLLEAGHRFESYAADVIQGVSN